MCLKKDRFSAGNLLRGFDYLFEAGLPEKAELRVLKFY